MQARLYVRKITFSRVIEQRSFRCGVAVLEYMGSCDASRGVHSGDYFLHFLHPIIMSLWYLSFVLSDIIECSLDFRRF